MAKKYKTCKKCGEVKELCEFSIAKHRLDGRNSVCQDCNRKYQREYYRKKKSKKAKSLKKQEELKFGKLKEIINEYVIPANKDGLTGIDLEIWKLEQKQILLREKKKKQEEEAEKRKREAERKIILRKQEAERKAELAKELQKKEENELTIITILDSYKKFITTVKTLEAAIIITNDKAEVIKRCTIKKEMSANGYFYIDGTKEGYKQCTVCDKTKPISLFNNSNSSKDGKKSSCAECDLIRGRVYSNLKKRYKMTATTVRKKTP